MRGRQPWAPLQKSQMTPESSVLFVLQENSASRIMSNKTFILRKIHTIGSFCCSRPPFHQWHSLILLLTSGMRSKITSDKCFARQIATHNQFQFVKRTRERFVLQITLAVVCHPLSKLLARAATLLHYLPCCCRNYCNEEFVWFRACSASKLDF